jgi:hypothetical protein
MKPPKKKLRVKRMPWAVVAKRRKHFLAKERIAMESSTKEAKLTRKPP